MKIKLQERHLCFVVNHLSNIIAGQYFKLLSEIRDKIKDQGYHPTDEVEVEVDKSEVLVIYFEIGQKPEYFVSAINKEMKVLLQTQFLEKATAYQVLLSTLGVSDLTQVEIDALPPSDQTIVYEGKDTQWLVNQITQRDLRADADLETLIQAGRNLIS